MSRPVVPPPAGPDDPDSTVDPDETPEPVLISAPAEPLDPPRVTESDIDAAVARLAAGTGPLAVDAERASGYRYSQRAYLVQLWREGVGTVLIDPIDVAALPSLQRSLGDEEWILHAASQDLPCLRELGLEPHRLFDTELAGRLLGMERVSLVTMLVHFCGITLEKGHSAADWSTRPLPEDWLVYAALDVEFLLQLRDAVESELERQGKTEWARQEFEAVLAAPPPSPRTDPWRRTSGIHQVRSRRQLAGVRALWEARDELASSRDTAPGRVLPDSAIVAAVRANPATAADLAKLPTFKGPRQRKHAARWFAALAAAHALTESELPPSAGPSDGDGVPPAARWRERDPEAAERLAHARTVIAELAEKHVVQVQNLLAGDVVRRLCWTPPELTVDAVAGALTELGARPWQVELTAAELTAALQTAAAPTS
ncbi:MAG: HRDC domain-containing protein [Jatrophihabitans sp.]